MVLQLNTLLIYNVYLLPETSQWAGVLERDPCDTICEALAASLALAYAAHFLVLVLGDLNARTAALLANIRDPPRISMDTGNPSQRGRWLCSVFNDYDISSAFPIPHTGRSKLAAMKDANRRKVMDAPSRAIF
jgi:hypothetical protein